MSFGNPLLFKDVTPEDIDDVQNYIKNDLPKILDAALMQCGEQYNNKQKSCFFGAFSSIPECFYITGGDKKLIAQAVLSVKKSVENEIEGIEHFSKERFNANKDRIPFEYAMFNSVFGFVFGDTREIQKVQQECVLKEHQMRLFVRAKTVFDKFLTDETLPVTEFTLESVVIISKNADQLHGTILCRFCEETDLKRHIKVFYRVTGKGSWILSNLETHMNRFHTNGGLPRKRYTKRKTISVNNQIKIEHAENNSNELNEIIKKDDLEMQPTNKQMSIALDIQLANEDDSDFDDSDGFNSICLGEVTLYAQMKQQTIKMCNSTTKNCDKVTQTQLESSGKGIKDVRIIQVCEIKGDGNCLFSSLVHQLFGFKVSSSHHKKLVLEMRKDVTEYINQNLSEFYHEIKGRLYESKNKNVADVDAECRKFLDKQLSKDKFWGGTETIKAISRMHNVNIVIFLVDGSCYLSYPYDPQCSRTLLLFYNGSDNRSENNHYDSVVGVNDEKLKIAAKTIVDSDKQRKNMNVTNSSHISVS